MENIQIRRDVERQNGSSPVAVRPKMSTLPEGNKKKNHERFRHFNRCPNTKQNSKTRIVDIWATFQGGNIFLTLHSSINFFSIWQKALGLLYFYWCLKICNESWLIIFFGIFFCAVCNKVFIRILDMGHHLTCYFRYKIRQK